MANGDNSYMHVAIGLVVRRIGQTDNRELDVVNELGSVKY